MNVHHLLILLIVPLISGCSALSWFKRDEVKPIEIQTKQVERTPLNIADPTPLKGREIKWVVITPQNAEQVWQKLTQENTDLVLFALTDDGYESLAITMAELRNFIAQQRTIILQYKNYYEPPKSSEKGK